MTNPTDDEVTDCIKHHLPAILNSDFLKDEGAMVWQCRECIRETKEINKPVILEHDGIKEIMTTYHVGEAKLGTLKICPKCTHYRCICKYREMGL